MPSSSLGTGGGFACRIDLQALTVDRFTSLEMIMDGGSVNQSSLRHCCNLSPNEFVSGLFLKS